MSDQKMGKQSEVKGKANPVAVAVAGAAIGAGIAVAGVVLSDEINREKIVKIASTVKGNVKKYVDKTQKKMEVEKKILGQRISADKLKVKKVVASAKNSLDKTTKEVNNAIKSL
ncbi:MAG: hypothetical protein NUV65_03885 [Candidatus Roizmanbacteria bacterium]|nr:hypothetical protein [Candidatus Roizmanbacteria bacterium]